MRKKRFKSILAVILAASMIMGSQSPAFAVEGVPGSTDSGQTVSQEVLNEEPQTGGEIVEGAAQDGEDAGGAQTEETGTEAGKKDDVSGDAAIASDKEGISSDDAQTGLTDVPEAEQAESEEEAKGAGDPLRISLSADSVSYDGKRKNMILSTNKADGFTYKYVIVSANATEPLVNYDYSKSVSRDVVVNPGSVVADGDGKKFGFTVSAVNAGWYAVSVNAYENGTGKISANALGRLRINKAGKVYVQADGLKKYYDGEKLSSNSVIPRRISGDELYFNEESGKNDIELITVSNTDITDVGKKQISVNVSDKKLTDNYEAISVSAGCIEIVSVDLVIRSADVKKIYDGKPVDEKDREGFTISVNEGADGEALTKNLGLKASDFVWDKSSLISGTDGVYVSENKFELTSAARDKFYVSGNVLKGNFASVKLETGNILVKKYASDIPANGLTAPVITSARMNAKGWVTIKWKKAKSYKGNEGNTYKNKTRYMIYRYDPVEKLWVKINTSNTTVADFGQTGTSFVDKQGGRLDSSAYIYKVNVVGYDENGVYGTAKEASYCICRPIALEVSTRQKEFNTLDFEISNIRGAGDYIIERSYKKNFKEIQKTVTISASDLGRRVYYGSKLVSANSFKDDGKLVTSGVKNPAESVYYTDKDTESGVTYYYRAKVTASVMDYDIDGMPFTRTVESEVASPLSGKCTIYPPDMLWTFTASYNGALVAFEKLSDNVINTKDDQGSKKDKYQILCSTKADSGYKVVKTFTAKQLEHPDNIDNMFLIPGGAEISVNGVYAANKSTGNITAPGDCYAYYFTGLKPEVTYYYKVRAVKEGVKGPSGIPITVTPRMDDVENIEWSASNYNYITVKVDHVIGSKEMAIYYWAVLDDKGNIIPSDNKLGYNHKKKKVFAVKYDKKKKVYTEKFKVPGLKYGYTYKFYAQPKNGKEHVNSDPVKYAEGMTLPGVAVLKASAKSLTEINVSWKAVAGATGYEVIVEDPESNSVTKAYFKKAGTHVWKGGAGSWDGKQVTPGKPYNFSIRTFKKSTSVSTGNDPRYENGTGLWSGCSEPVTEWGRPAAPTSPKTAWGEVAGAGAKITWTHTKDRKTYPKNIYYAIEKRVYKYNAGSNTVSTKYVSSNIVGLKAKLPANSCFDNTTVTRGDKIVYRIYSVFYDENNRHYGDDGFVLGKAVNVVYAAPYSISVAGDNEVQVGNTVKWNVSYTPAYTTMKKLTWKSDNTGVATVDSSGNIKGVKEGTANITARSVHDPDKIFFTKRITVKAVPTASKGNLKVCIDAGHGGSDSGATRNGLLEKTCNLEMANAMKSQLEAYGVPVVMTRSGDSYISVGDRPVVAANNGCNLFISIHCNSGGGTGTEVWKSITSYHDDGLADRIMGSVAGAFGIITRGVKTRTGDNGDYYGVIRGSAAAGITGMIVETAFIDGDFDKLNNSTMKQNAGAAIANAILEHYGYK